MKQHIQAVVTQALTHAIDQGILPAEAAIQVHVERTRERQHGDFSTNAAMVLAKRIKRKPRDVATIIVNALPSSPLIESVEIAGPGFINFFLAPKAYHTLIADVLAQGSQFGYSQAGRGRRIQVEFVSANPTGPLHVGHGRGAAFGASLANVLEAAGFEVEREYYVNDAGRQMDILAASVYIRYLEQHGSDVSFPANGYRGEYIKEIAAALHSKVDSGLFIEPTQLFADLPADAPEGDGDRYIDALIHQTKTNLGSYNYRLVFDNALDAILNDIREDLAEFGVTYQNWFSERSLADDDAIEATLASLRQADYLYQEQGAWWFRSTAFGDEKDRVVQRENGQTTYFASDIAYHLNKFQRGFDQVINIWGADHHGYISRVKGALQAINIDAQRLSILLVQFVNLYRGGERASMSTRSGEFITLRELRQEVGNDAARFFYILRKSEQHLDFDLDLAKSQSKDNPVFYIQYAHARICSVARRRLSQDLTRDIDQGNSHLDRLTHEREVNLMVTLSRYPEVVVAAATNYEPHLIAHYLQELATELHKYYDHEPRVAILDDDDTLRDARLNLCEAVRQTLANGLGLLGVKTPEVM